MARAGRALLGRAAVGPADCPHPERGLARADESAPAKTAPPGPRPRWLRAERRRSPAGHWAVVYPSRPGKGSV